MSDMGADDWDGTLGGASNQGGAYDDVAKVGGILDPQNWPRDTAGSAGQTNATSETGFDPLAGGELVGQLNALPPGASIPVLGIGPMAPTGSTSLWSQGVGNPSVNLAAQPNVLSVTTDANSPILHGSSLTHASGVPQFLQSGTGGTVSSIVSNPSVGGQQVGQSSVIPDGTFTNKNWDDPANRQQEIDDALKAWNFNTFGWPVQYDPSLNQPVAGNINNDPAITDSYTGVRVGPLAFSGSYGNFVSTLDHEVGAHVSQLHQGILAASGPGLYMNEVQAYDRELADAQLHHLTSDEIGGILSNRNSYFNLLDAENQDRIRNGIYTPHP